MLMSLNIWHCVCLCVGAVSGSCRWPKPCWPWRRQCCSSSGSDDLLFTLHSVSRVLIGGERIDWGHLGLRLILVWPSPMLHVSLFNLLPSQSALILFPLFFPHQAGVGSAASSAWPSLLHAERSPRSDQEADPLQDHAVVTARVASYSLWRKKSVLKPVNIQ